MRLTDITVEVRDKTLTRIGLIRPEELDLQVHDLHNNVGTWTLKLAAEHRLTPVLRRPGSGIIVTGPTDVLLSGPTIKPENAATATDPAGTVTFDGVDDTVLLADALAYPEPGNGDPATQKAANDERRGPVESLMHQFVNANIGPAAPPVRRDAALLSKLTMGADRGRGPVTTKSARFKVLGNLLAELAVVADLGFRVVQRGDALVFETYVVRDRTADIRLDVLNSTLAGHRVAMSPPGVTHVLVAGQQEGVNRQFVHRTNPQALAAQAAWGRRIERFVDQRNTDKVEELQQAGDEVLADEGFATLAVQVVPMEDSAMPFGTTWKVGDRVAVVVEGQELSSTVTGYVLKANADGFTLGALIGDPQGFDPQAALGRRVNNVEARVSSLEHAGKGGPAVAVARWDDVYDATPDQLPAGESLHYLLEDYGQGLEPDATVQSFKSPSGDTVQLWMDSYANGSPDISMRTGAGDEWSSFAYLVTDDRFNDLGAYVRELAQRPVLTDTTNPVTDWDSITRTGYYTGLSAANGPAAGSQIVGHAVAFSAGSLVVTAWDVQTEAAVPGRTWQRRRINTVWGPWLPLQHPSWTPIDTLGTGVSKDTGSPPRVCITDGQIRYRGRLNLTGFVNGATVCSVPTGFAPATTQYASVACNQVSGGQPVCRLDLSLTGDVRLYYTGAAPAWVALDGASAFLHS
jgi:hypothetical protein